MKQIGSEISGLPSQGEMPPSAIGSPHGETGVARTSSAAAPPITPTDLAKANASLRQFAVLALKGQAHTDPKMLADVIDHLAAVEGSCNWKKAETDLLEMIDGYARPGVTNEIIASRAKGFMIELTPFPTWAVIRAIRWWKSVENTYRYRAPLPGDIAERCIADTEAARVARTMLNRALAKPETDR